MEKDIMNNKRFSSMFVVGRSLGQNIPSGAYTVIEWNNQFYDELDEMAIVNPWTFIPKVAGYYYLYASARISALNVGDRFDLSFRLNGVIAINYRYNLANALNEDITLNVSGLELIRSIDNVDVVVWHNFGALRVIGGNAIETRFFGYRIR